MSLRAQLVEVAPRTDDEVEIAESGVVGHQRPPRASLEGDSEFVAHVAPPQDNSKKKGKKVHDGRPRRVNITKTKGQEVPGCRGLTRANGGLDGSRGQLFPHSQSNAEAEHAYIIGGEAGGLGDDFEAYIRHSSHTGGKIAKAKRVTRSVLQSLEDTGYAVVAAGSAAVIGASQAAAAFNLDPALQIVQGLQDFGAMAQPYFDYLPVAGLVGASLDFINAGVNLYYTPHSSYAVAKSAIKMLGSAAQGYAGYNFLASAMVIGSPAFGYMALGMAVNAGAKTVASCIDVHQLRIKFNAMREDESDYKPAKKDTAGKVTQAEFESPKMKTLRLEYRSAQRKLATNLLAFIGWGLIGTVTIAAALSPAAPALLFAGAVCLAAMALVATVNLFLAGYNKKYHGHAFFAVPNSVDRKVEKKWSNTEKWRAQHRSKLSAFS